jgi:putative ATP-binding cassette transporter
MFLAILAGIICGISASGLIVIMNLRLGAVRDTPQTLILAFGALCLVLPLSRFTAQFTLTKIGQQAVRKIRLDLSRQILAAPLRKLEEFGSHGMMAMLTDDVMAITLGLVAIPTICIQGAVVVTSLGYLGWLSWKLFLVTLAAMALGTITVQAGMRAAYSYLTLARQEGDRLYKHLQTLFDGATELKLHRARRIAFLGETLQSSATSYQQLNVKGHMIMVGTISWAHVVYFALVGLLLFFLPRFIPVNIETLNGYTLTLLNLIISFDVIATILPSVGRGVVAINKVDSLGLSLKTEAENDRMEQPEPAPKLEAIELCGITHTYCREQENSVFTLGPIDARLRAGELVFLVGGNGSGKTTLAKLLAGLYRPEQGEIRLNGEAITDENREFYRQHFSVIFSSFYLFDTLLGMRSEDLQAKADHYLIQLQLNHKVEIKDGALSTIDLSQGQRKRLALLTAYLEDRPCYIFDEWAADQDPEFKTIFYHHLLPELKARGKMVLVITHDDRYYGVADRIIKLEDGRLKSDGRGIPGHATTQAISSRAGD